MLRICRRDLIILFTGKLILLAVLFFACFSPKSRPTMGDHQMSQLLLPEEEK